MARECHILVRCREAPGIFRGPGQAACISCPLAAYAGGTLDSAIIDKIRKLHALAERAGTEHEAALAAARVAELCLRHHLELGAVLIAQQETRASFTRIPHGGFWQVHRTSLSHAVKTLLDVNWYRSHAPFVDRRRLHGYYVVFYGLKANVEAAALTYRYLDESAEAMLKDARRKGLLAKGVRANRSFRIGCAARILHETEKLAQKTKKARAKSKESQAIVALSDELKRRFADDLRLKNIPHRRSTRDYEAYAAGYAAGARVNLHGARPDRLLNG